MKIQRGIVKYKDRNDIVCTYALTDDGKQYYFLDENDAKKFTNGNRIATTALVEAVDPMVKATNVGVIDQNGVIVVPFENRSIRLANDNVIIVEKAVPTSQSVLDAIELRSDPASATQLVSTPATIKDRLKAQMGSDGNYLFNDQFSEATICDINGTNLVGGECYSFISMANDRLYLSKNTVDSPISEFSLTTYELGDSQSVDTAEAIDVSAAAVDPQVVEGALTDTVDVQEAVAPVEGDVPVDAMAAAEGVDFAVSPEEETNKQDFHAVVEVPEDAPVATEEAEGAAVAEDSQAVTENTVTPDEAMATTSEGEARENDFHAVVEVPEDAPVATEGEEVTTTENTEMPQELSATDNSISDDLKAFANGAPSDEEVAPQPVEDAMVEIPPIVEEENGEVAEAQDVVEENKMITDETPVEEAPVEETREEVFSSNVMDTNEPEKVMRKVIEPVSIDAETVLATVDRNMNGIIDSDEVMVPQAEEKPASQPEHSSLTDIFSNEEPAKDYDLPTSFSPSYTTTPSYDSYSSLLDNKPERVPYDSYGAIGSDNIMADVAKSMSELMRQNKEQRGIISQYQSKVESLESQTRMLAEKFKDQSVRYEALSGKLRSLDEATGRLESRNQLLENRVHDQEKIIASQERELKVLRPQVEGKQDLVRLLADARTLLGSESNYGYDEGSNYYGRRAA